MLGFLIQHVEALDIIVSHGGKGEIELCMESDGYNNPCDDFNLVEWTRPLEAVNNRFSVVSSFIIN